MAAITESSTSTTLRQRKGGKAPVASKSSDSSSSKQHLQRSQSWHAAAADHVLSRRRYFLLSGVLLGVASVFAARVWFSDQPIEDIFPIPSETVSEYLAHVDMVHPH